MRPSRTLEMQVTPAVLEMARAGYGIAVVPRWILAAQASTDALVVLPLGRDGLKRVWYAAYERHRAKEAGLRGLVEVLRGSEGTLESIDRPEDFPLVSKVDRH